MHRFRGHIIGALFLFIFLSTTTAAAQTVRFGFITDFHYQEYSVGNSQSRMDDFVDSMTANLPDFVIENGDFMQGSLGPLENLVDLADAESLFSLIPVPHYHAIGNHDVYHGTNLYDVMDVLGMTDDYYSFDFGPYHFIVLNACYDSLGFQSSRGKGFIPPDEEEWLIGDLALTDKYTIVFSHHPFDDAGVSDSSLYIYQRRHFRHIFENSNKVIAVFQGHLHTTFEWDHNGIAYFGIENSGFYKDCTFARISLDPVQRMIEVQMQPDGWSMHFAYGPKAPFPFALLEPPKETYLQALDDTLSWCKPLDLDLGDVITYDLYLDTDSLFNQPLVVSDLADTFWIIDPPLPSGTKYYWKVAAKDSYGLTQESAQIGSFITPLDSSVTGVEAGIARIPSLFAFPNPFTGAVSLRYFASGPGASLKIYDVAGRMIRDIPVAEGEGWGQAAWDGTTGSGEEAGSGVYFAVLRTGRSRVAAKLLLLR